MHLTRYTDYALRILIYLAAKPEGDTVSRIAESYGISRNHLVKVAHHLGRLGYIETTRGKSGGLSLVRPPSDINIGSVVRDMEPNFHLVECFNPAGNACPIAPVCKLKGVMAEAERAFMAALSAYTLADIVVNRTALLRLLDHEE